MTMHLVLAVCVIDTVVRIQNIVTTGVCGSLCNTSCQWSTSTDWYRVGTWRFGPCTWSTTCLTYSPFRSLSTMLSTYPDTTPRWRPVRSRKRVAATSQPWQGAECIRVLSGSAYSAPIDTSARFVAYDMESYSKPLTSSPTPSQRASQLLATVCRYAASTTRLLTVSSWVCGPTM